MRHRIVSLPGAPSKERARGDVRHRKFLNQEHVLLNLGRHRIPSLARERRNVRLQEIPSLDDLPRSADLLPIDLLRSADRRPVDLQVSRHGAHRLHPGHGRNRQRKLEAARGRVAQDPVDQASPGESASKPNTVLISTGIRIGRLPQFVGVALFRAGRHSRRQSPCEKNDTARDADSQKNYY